MTFVDTNVCAVDWSPLSFTNYFQAALVNTHRAGNVVTEFIQQLNKLGISPNNVTIAGHSLGGQMSGYIGKKIHNLGFSLPNIYGNICCYI